MRRAHEEHWRDQPPDPEPWEWERRRDLLLAELPPGARWLDLGCGTGRFLTLAPGGIGADVAEGAVERARTRAPDVRLMDGEAIALGHGEVGFVWCSEVLGFVPDALGLLQECRRVLEPQGRIVVTVPGYPLRARLRAPDPLDLRVRFFTPVSLARTLRAAGFESQVEGSRWLVARGVRR